MKPDFGGTSADYARHRAGFPDSFFEPLAAFGIGRAGQRVLDLGTGTGSLARGFARRGCRGVGIDPSESMLAGSLSPDRVAAFDAEHAALLEARFPGEILQVAHRVFAVVARPPERTRP